MADVIDLPPVEETPITRGMRRREARKAAKEKGSSRIIWIIVGSLATVLTFRAMDSIFPRQQPLPPPPPPVPEI